MNYLAVKNFDRFQHYKDRNPEWIKLYASLLSDYAFCSLPDATKAHLILIYLLASKTDNKIPDDPKWVGQQIQSKSRVDLSALREAGFLVEWDETSARGKREDWPTRYIPAPVRAAILDRDKHRCIACGSTKHLEIDHVIPISRGGTSDESNLQTLCRSCNRSKRATLASEGRYAEAEQVATQTNETAEPHARPRDRGEGETEKEESQKKQTPTPSGRTRGRPAPWMGEINRVWGEVFPDAKAPTGAAKMLSPIVDKFGIERVAAELGVYLRATQPQFLSLPKFCATFGGSSVAGTITPKKQPIELEAEDIWTLCKRYGFAQCTRTTIDGELQRALEAGDIDDVEAFRGKLRKLDIPFLRAVQTDKAAVKSIAERLAA